VLVEMQRAQSAPGLIRGSGRNVHPSMRLDKMLKSDDALYRPGDQPQRGEAFVRHMVAFGRTRPSTGFIAESRAARPLPESRVNNDASKLPPTWNDSHADPREGCYTIPEPPLPDASFVALYQNHGLMTASERYREFLYMKEHEKQWREDKRALSEYKKRKMVLTRKHKSGIVGIDSLTQHGTENFPEERANLLHEQACFDTHDRRRNEFLTNGNYATDEAALRNWGEPVENQSRGHDIPLQRKFNTPEVHPFRYLDTHARLFPKLAPKWNPERAMALMMHDSRGRRHDLISGKDYPSYKRLHHSDGPVE